MGSERDRSWKHTMMGGFKIWLGSIFYWNNVVGEDTNSIYTKIWRHPSRAQKRNHRCMPVPGSAKKKSVISYLSTERVFRTVGHREDIVVPYVVTYASRYNAYIHLYKKYLGNTLSPRYYITPHSSLKWMNNAALEEANNRGVLVNTSQVGNFWKAS